MFGRYEHPFSLIEPDLTLELKQEDGGQTYLRECRGEKVRKVLAAGENTLIIHPVEPVNLPLPLAHHLEIAFPHIIIPPGTAKKIHCVFPVEIGVFLESGSSPTLIDIFSFHETKFSLYGMPASGVITRWYQSAIHESVPATDPWREGVIELTIKNSGQIPAEIGRAVFESASMHLFFGEYVGMAATMEIFSPALAETSSSSNKPGGFTDRAVELYTARSFPVVQTKGYLMEAGLV